MAGNEEGLQVALYLLRLAHVAVLLIDLEGFDCFWVLLQLGFLIGCSLTKFAFVALIFGAFGAVIIFSNLKIVVSFCAVGFALGTFGVKKVFAGIGGSGVMQCFKLSFGLCELFG